MNKIGLIISREYFTRVKKKSFFLTTILVPIVIIGFYAAIIAIAVQGGTDKQSVAVLDETNLLDGKAANPESSISLKYINNETEAGFIKKYKGQGYDAFLYIPAFSLDSPANFKLHAQSAPSITMKSSLENIINKAVVNKRLLAQGID